jgi:hypothetical protein
VVLVVKAIASAVDGGSGPRMGGEAMSALQVHDLNRAREYIIDTAQRHGLDVFTDITLACEYIVSKLQDKSAKESGYLGEVEAFVRSDEFLEKTIEEFVRCDTRASNRLDRRQLLLACVHLEQDLRPLLPAQAAKHRQPTPQDVEHILRQFGTPGADGSAATELDAEQFLTFSRVLFRNVCAHVKL